MARTDVAVLLTGVGKRYDIVSAFRQHAFTIACDPSLPQTPHVGGILAGLGDGSVRTVAPTISQWTFAAACTPAGNETLGSDW